MAYVASLEERLRAHEEAHVQANLQAQKLAKQLSAENQKMKKALVDACGFDEADIDGGDVQSLVEKMKRKPNGVQSPHLDPGMIDGGLNRSENILADGKVSSSTPFARFWSDASHPGNEASSSGLPTPPSNMDEGSSDLLLLTLTPQSLSTALHGENSGAVLQQIHGLLKLTTDDSTNSFNAVPCYVNYDLLRILIEGQGLVLRSTVSQLIDGMFLGTNGSAGAKEGETSVSIDSDQVGREV